MSKQFSLEISIDRTTDIYGRCIQQLQWKLHPTNYYWFENLLNSNPALSYKEIHFEPNLMYPGKSKIVIDFYS